eukprot:10068266-Lingulodinium_polyedra.AAC.1
MGPFEATPRVHVVEQGGSGDGVGELELGRGGKAAPGVDGGAEGPQPLELAFAAEGHIGTEAALVISHRPEMG